MGEVGNLVPVDARSEDTAKARAALVGATVAKALAFTRTGDLDLGELETPF